MKPGRVAWAAVALLWVVALLNYVDRQVIFSVFPLLRAEMGLSDVQLGLLSTVFLWVYGFASPLGGYFADRFGRKRTIVASLLVWTAVTWATGYATTFSQLIAARALMGISEACYLPAALALIADHHQSSTRSLATGLHQSGLYAGIVIGGAAGGWLGEHYGWRLPFLLLGASGVAYAFVLVAGLKEPVRTTIAGAGAKPQFLDSVGAAVRLPGFGGMLAAFCAFSITNWIVYTWMPLYLYQKFGMSLTSAGFSATFYIQAASFAGILAGGWMADRWSSRTARGRIYTQTLGMAMAAPFLLLVGVTASESVLIAALLVFGLGRGLYDCNAMPVLAQVAHPQLRATGYGIFNLAGCVMGGTMAAVAGALKPLVGLEGAIVGAAVLLLASALILRATARHMDATASQLHPSLRQP